jgi:hypothetical protein
MISEELIKLSNLRGVHFLDSAKRSGDWREVALRRLQRRVGCLRELVPVTFGVGIRPLEKDPTAATNFVSYP